MTAIPDRESWEPVDRSQEPAQLNKQWQSHRLTTFAGRYYWVKAAFMIPAPVTSLGRPLQPAGGLNGASSQRPAGQSALIGRQWVGNCLNFPTNPVIWLILGVSEQTLGFLKGLMAQLWIRGLVSGPADQLNVVCS